MYGFSVDARDNMLYYIGSNIPLRMFGSPCTMMLYYTGSNIPLSFVFKTLQGFGMYSF